MAWMHVVHLWQYRRWKGDDPRNCPTTRRSLCGLHAARVFGIAVHATRDALPQDSLRRITRASLEEGATSSHRWYGWITA